MKTRSFVLLILSAVLMAMPIGCSKPHEASLARPEVKGVETQVVEVSTMPLGYKVNGTIKAETVSTVASRVMGEVKHVHIKKGQKIKKGQLLVTIDDRDLAQKVKAAQEAYDEASRALESAREQSEFADKTYNRMKEMYDKQALSEQEFDKASTERKVRANELERLKSMLKRTGAGLEEARLYLGYANVTAPFDSVVIKTHVDDGSLATPGAPLLTIEDPSAFKLETNMDARYFDAVKPGMDVEVTFESLGQTCTAYVARVIPSIDPATRTFPVEIKSGDKRPPEGMRTGLFANITFNVGSKDAMLVPASAVVKKGQLEGVYVVLPDGVVAYRLVRTGQVYLDRVEIVSGLKPGDRIITKGIEAAFDGGKIKE